MITLVNPMIVLARMSEQRRRWIGYRFNGGKLTYRVWKATMKLHERTTH